MIFMPKSYTYRVRCSFFVLRPIGILEGTTIFSCEILVFDAKSSSLLYRQSRQTPVFLYILLGRVEGSRFSVLILSGWAFYSVLS